MPPHTMKPISGGWARLKPGYDDRAARGKDILMTRALSKNDLIRIIKSNMDTLRSRFGVKRVAVFGSFSTETQTESSDVDIVVELERPLGLEFVELSEYLEKTISRKTDVPTKVGLDTIHNKTIAQDIINSLDHV
ncbi:MAG: nucleotidyltransferase [Chitinivibrionales bacterium]|nr:nucleotidyltransferase [Chitinivibrionales bacterium]MBD3395388.1 nucleotidyltransferase [Chitinivibrionales bacterium]